MASLFQIKDPNRHGKKTSPAADVHGDKNDWPIMGMMVMGDWRDVYKKMRQS
jgi:hypothetical protein